MRPIRVLSGLTPKQRETLIAVPADGGLRFDIHLQDRGRRRSSPADGDIKPLGSRRGMAA